MVIHRIGELLHAMHARTSCIQHLFESAFGASFKEIRLLYGAMQQWTALSLVNMNTEHIVRQSCDYLYKFEQLKLHLNLKLNACNRECVPEAWPEMASRYSIEYKLNRYNTNKKKKTIENSIYRNLPMRMC